MQAKPTLYKLSYSPASLFLETRSLYGAQDGLQVIAIFLYEPSDTRTIRGHHTHLVCFLSIKVNYRTLSIALLKTGNSNTHTQYTTQQKTHVKEVVVT